MATQKSSDHSTPNGGVRSTIYYLDDAGNPADESVATKAVIHEYDAQGNSIFRTYGTLNRGEQPQPE